MNYFDLTKEKIEEALKEVFYNNPMPDPVTTDYFTSEDGTKMVRLSGKGFLFYTLAENWHKALDEAIKKL